MSAVTLSHVEGCFDRIGWKYWRRSETSLYTGTRCSVPYSWCIIPIECQVTQHWVVLRAILTRRAAKATLGATAIVLGNLNARCYQARFCLLGSAVILQNEIPAVNWSSEGFLNALQAILRYASIYGEEVMTVAENSSVGELIGGLLTTASPSYGDNPAFDESSFDLSANRIPDQNGA